MLVHHPRLGLPITAVTVLEPISLAEAANLEVPVANLRRFHAQLQEVLPNTKLLVLAMIFGTGAVINVIISPLLKLSKNLGCLKLCSVGEILCIQLNIDKYVY